MKNAFYIIMSLLALTVFSCNLVGRRVKGNGNRVSDTRSVNSASNIKVSGPFDVVLSEGPTQVIVDADENLQQYITVDNQDGKLSIKTRDRVNLYSKEDITVRITTPDLQAISILGSGDVTSNSKFSGSGNMVFKITGSGDLSIPLNSPSVSASVTGSGNMNLSGETRDLKLKLTGSGKFEGYDLKSEAAEITIAGSGDALVFAAVKLNARISGSGSVSYKGNAAVTKKVSGSGSVNHVN